MQQQVKVLLVDDDREVRGFLKEMLEVHRFFVTDTPSGTGALKRIQWEVPDIVLLDYSMPVMDGLETLTHIKQSHLFLPVIMLTAVNEKAIFFRAGQFGADDYVLKPPDITELIEKIKKLTSRRKPANNEYQYSLPLVVQDDRPR